MRRLPWRVKSDPWGGFDELVVGSGKECLLHAEMMDKNAIAVNIGDLLVWACVEKGVVKVTHVEGYEKKRGKRR